MASLKDYGELGVSALTSAAIEPFAGWGGILSLTSGKGDSSKVVEGFRKKAYKSEGSERAAKEVGQVISNNTPDWVKSIGDYWSSAQDSLGEVSPMAGAAMATLPEALMMGIPAASRISKLKPNTLPNTLGKNQAGVLVGLTPEERRVFDYAIDSNPDKMWKERLMGKTPSGQYVKEIPDNELMIDSGNKELVATLDPSSDDPWIYLKNRFTEERPTVGEIVKHPEFDKDPRLAGYKGMEILPVPAALPNTKGLFDPTWKDGKGLVALGGNKASSVRETLSHELAHYAQNKTGLNQGTSVGPAYEKAIDVIDQANKRIEALAKERGVDSYLLKRFAENPDKFSGDSFEAKYHKASLDKLSKSDIERVKSLNDILEKQARKRNAAWDRYESSEGESLARAAQNRSLMGREELKANPYLNDPEAFKKFTGTTLDKVLLQIQRNKRLHK